MTDQATPEGSKPRSSNGGGVSTSAKPGAYTADSIQVLEGLDAVRRRPGMYIGSTDARGLHHLVWEVVDNSIDEAMAGHATSIEVTVLADGSVRNSDDGRGVPVGRQKQTGKDALEVVHTVLHAGGKFGGGGYKVSGGLHGVGVSVVNALSEALTVESVRDGTVYTQSYVRGKPSGPVTAIGSARGRTGTTTVFKPDHEVFELREEIEEEGDPAAGDVFAPDLEELPPRGNAAVDDRGNPLAVRVLPPHAPPLVDPEPAGARDFAQRLDGKRRGLLCRVVVGGRR